MLQRFEVECELLGRLHHPNIVQFLGVHVETGSELPVLVMEYLPTNLSSYLDSHGVLPAEIGYGILRNVALGLRYLHEYSPPIVHRDLSSNNVLLTASLVAKIFDLGVAKILNISPSQMTQQMSTKVPATPCYMPPEALMARPRYTRKIDSYSFGVMILHVLCGEWPFPTDAFQPDAHNPDNIVPVTEVNRRVEFLQQMGRDHPLSWLVRQCLSNTPDKRPESADILQHINTALSQVPAPAETVFQQLETLRSENQRQGSEIQRQGSEMQRLEDETRRLGNENQSIMTEVQGLRSDNQKLGRDNQRLKNENQRLDNENQSFRTEVQSLRSEIPTLREHFQTQQSSSGAAVNQPLTREVERLSVRDLGPRVRDLGPRVRAATNSTESQLHPGVRLQWRRCADAPVEMNKAQAIVVGEKMYVGGGVTTSIDDGHQIFQYSRRGDTWSILPRCPVRCFGMAYFMGRIITVGGWDFSRTNKVHSLREESQRWEKFIVSMLTARCYPSVATTSVAIIVAGGKSGWFVYSSAVEVYSSDTSQWHTADHLPKPYARMSSVAINDVWYLMSGTTTSDCWYVLLNSLVHKAVSRSASESVWSHLLPTPLKASTAACLSGSLVTVGGKKDDEIRSTAVYGFINSLWVKLSNGDLPSPRSSCTTAQLSPVEVIIIGGYNERTKTGTLHL